MDLKSTGCIKYVLVISEWCTKGPTHINKLHSEALLFQIEISNTTQVEFTMPIQHLTEHETSMNLFDHSAVC
jgi:hypothetical protein